MLATANGNGGDTERVLFVCTPLSEHWGRGRVWFPNSAGLRDVIVGFLVMFIRLAAALSRGFSFLRTLNHLSYGLTEMAYVIDVSKRSSSSSTFSLPQSFFSFYNA